MGSLIPREKAYLGSNAQPKHVIAVLCCHIANTSEDFGKRATTIPLFTKLLQSLLYFVAAFRLSRKIASDKEMLDLEIASVAKLNAKTIY